MVFALNQQLTTAQLNDFRPGSRVRVPVGTDAVPTYSFLTDTDTGMFRPGSNVIGFATSGIERLRISDGSVAMGGLRLGFGDVTNTASDVIIKTTASQYVFRQDGIDTMQIDPDRGGLGLRGTRIRINGIDSDDYIEWDTSTADNEFAGMAIVANGERVWKGFSTGTKTRWMFGPGTDDFFDFDHTNQELIVSIDGLTRMIVGRTRFYLPRVFNDTTSSAANLNVGSDGRIRRSTA